MKVRRILSQLSMVTLLTVVLCSCQKPIQYRHSSEAPNTMTKWKYGFEGFLRYDGYGKVAGDMEVPVVDYVMKGNNVKLRMVGVVHLADKDYYQELQKVLDKADYVLYEGVHVGKDKTKLLKSAEIQWDAMGEMLGMTGQLSSINYNRKNWEQCDPATDMRVMLQRRMGNRKIPEQQRKLMLKNMERAMQMQGQVMGRLQIVRNIRQIKQVIARATGISTKMLEDYGKHQYALNMARTQKVGGPGLQWARLLRQLERQILRYRRMLPQSRELDQAINGFRMFINQFEKQLKQQARFIIVERNQFVMKVIRQKLKKLGNPKKAYTLAVFYGCGHFPDFERRLKKMGYERSKMVWLKAWKINSQYVKNPPRTSFPFGGTSTKPSVGKTEKTGKTGSQLSDQYQPKILNLLGKYSNAKYSARRNIQKSIHAMGDSAVPYLIKALLNDKDRNIRSAAANVLGSMRHKAKRDEVIEAYLKAIETDKYSYVRQICASRLSYLKPTSDDVMKRLIKVLVQDSNNTVKNNVSYTIARFGEKAVPHLVPIVEQESGYTRAYAILTISKVRKKDKYSQKLIPLLMKTMDDKNKYVRQFSVQALASFGTKAAPAVSKLIKAYKGEKSKYRKRDYIRAFSSIGPPAAPTVPLIIDFINDKSNSKYSRRGAVSALGKIKSNPAKSIPVISDFLKNGKDGWDKRTALAALKNFGPQAAPALPLVLKQLENKDKWAVRSAIATIGAMGAKAKSAVPALEKLAKDQSYTKWYVQRALKQIQSK